MANMLPATVPDDAPDSEKGIFEKLRSDKGCAAWTILHSLGLAQRGVRKPYGEIDFVIVAPGEGVLCIEVKGGGVECKGGQWSTTNRRGITEKLKRSPFEQVRDGMSAVRRSVEQEFGAGSTITKSFFGTVVIFPDVESPPQNIGYEDDEIVDVRHLNDDISAAISARIRSQRKRMGWIQNPSLTNAGDVAALVKFLRPDFVLRESRSTRIRRDQQALIRLTREQARFLDSYSENPRCLVKGAAGTGKTMLALETFKREVTAGNRTGLLCYNKVLGGWFERELSEHRKGGIVFGSIHDNLLALIKNASLYEEYCEAQKEIPSDKKNEIFDRLIPEYAIRALVEGGQSELDYLILDEAQDLIRPAFLDVFDVWLRGGLKKGRWSILGDFHNQAIYSADLRGADLLETLDKHIDNYATVKLNTNCRNTKNIAESTSLFSGFSTPPYEMNQIDGDPVNQSFWKNEKDLADLLETQINKLLDEDVLPKDIAILSPRKFGKSPASALKSNRFRIRDISNSNDTVPEDNEITFSTIHSFKGMESPVIILTDMDNISSDFSRSLLYIGMSRASSYLSVLFQEGARSDLKTIMSKKMSGAD